jgi:hypothetical protein
MTRRKKARKKRKKKTVATDRLGAALALLVAVTFAPLAILAQPQSRSHLHDPYAVLSGTLYGSDNRPVYGVRLTIRRVDQKKPKWEVMSDHSGEFAQRVPAGAADYVITAEIKTHKGEAKPQVTVHVDNDEIKDFSLHLK